MKEPRRRQFPRGRRRNVVLPHANVFCDERLHVKSYPPCEWARIGQRAPTKVSAKNTLTMLYLQLGAGHAMLAGMVASLAEHWGSAKTA